MFSSVRILLHWPFETQVLTFHRHKMSRAATLAQPIAPEFIFAFCQSSRAFSEAEFLPESPVYCPRDDFYTIKKSSKCSVYTLQMVRNLKNLVDSMIEENIIFDYDAFRNEMLLLPSASAKTSPEKIRGDYIYESVRLVGCMLIHCVDTRTSFIHVPSHLVVALKLALQKTDIGGCWGTMSGLFFFVAMIASAVAMRKPQHGFMGTIMARADHEIVYGNPIFEGATIAAWKLQRVHLELLRVWETSLTFSNLSLSPTGSSDLSSDWDSN